MTVILNQARRPDLSKTRNDQYLTVQGLLNTLFGQYFLSYSEHYPTPSNLTEGNSLHKILYASVKELERHAFNVTINIPTQGGII